MPEITHCLGGLLKATLWVCLCFLLLLGGPGTRVIALPCSVLLITPAASTLLCPSSAPGMLLFLPSTPFVMDGGQGRLMLLELAEL